MLADYPRTGILRMSQIPDPGLLQESELRHPRCRGYKYLPACDDRGIELVADPEVVAATGCLGAV